MSQTNNLNAEQRKALNKTIDLYVIANAKKFGGFRAHPVIVVPEFTLDNDEWVPVESQGARMTKKDGLLYLRLGMPVLVGLDVRVVKHNEFITDDKFELLAETLDLRIGDAIPDQSIVVMESVTPFSKTNPDNDLKYAGDTGIVCTFTGTLQDGTVIDSPAPIYRKTKLAPAGTRNSLIAHTNREEISAFQSAAWAQLNQVSTPAVKQAGIRTGAKK